MTQIGISPEVRTLALELANLGRAAETTLTGFSTEASLKRLISDLGTVKGTAHKLERALKARLASQAAADREAARLKTAQHKPTRSGALAVGA
jgi:outer membrane murein-binding lipoprotein Lpp